MEVRFTRTAALTCETVVLLDDGRSFRVSYQRGRPVPHDFAHFAIERELGWQTGFWGYVARGAVFPSMRQLGGRRRLHGDDRSRALLAAAKDFLGDAEGLATAVLKIVAESSDEDRAEVARVFAESWWPPASHAERLPYVDIRRACAALRQAAADWQTLSVGHSLTFTWSLKRGEHAPAVPPAPPKRPRSSFVRRAAARR
jgi:hypothetical protein